MKKRSIVGLVFVTGFALGAIASEVAVNGLHVFKAGDSIVASEVNANFSLLMQKISALEAKVATYETDHTLNPVIGSWNCISSVGPGSMLFKSNGDYSQWFPSFPGSATRWDYLNASFYHLVSLNSGTLQVEITFSDSNTKMQVVPLNYAGATAASCRRV